MDKPTNSDFSFSSKRRHTISDRDWSSDVCSSDLDFSTTPALTPRSTSSPVFDIMYGEGVSKTGELVDLGVKAGVVEKSGSWFSYDSQRIGQEIGRASCRERV